MAKDFGYSRMVQELRGEYAASSTSATTRLNNQPASRVGKQVEPAVATNRSGGSRPSSSGEILNGILIINGIFLASSREKISVTKSQPTSARDEKSNPPSR